MKKSTDFPANEPFFSVGFLGGNNVLLSRMLHTGFPIPISFHVAPKAWHQIDTGEIMDAKESHQVTPTDDPNLWGSMACASAIMTNTRHLY